MDTGHAFRTSDTALRLEEWSNGTVPVWTFRGNYQSLRPISVTSMSALPIGISKRFLNCSTLQPNILVRLGPENSHERRQPAITHPALLYAAPA